MIPITVAGRVCIDPPVVLSPMAGVTTMPMRTICEQLGVGLTVTEFLSADALCHGAQKTLDKLWPTGTGKPFAVQIFGREPEVLANAAVMVHEAGAELVDINMGCPAKRVVRGMAGSALMQEPELAEQLVAAVRRVLPDRVPVTVKHRAGWDDAHRNAPEFAVRMVDAGAAMITVHGRTRCQGFKGYADHAIIAATRAAVPAHVPVLGNGDVGSLGDLSRMRKNTGCDGVMIGRAAVSDPWLFRRIACVAAGAPDPGPARPGQLGWLVQRYLELALDMDVMPESRVVIEMRKFVAAVSKSHPGAASFRALVNQVTAAKALHDLVFSFFGCEPIEAWKPPDAPSPASSHGAIATSSRRAISMTAV